MTPSEAARLLGKKGGKKCFEKYGSKHMADLARKSAIARRNKKKKKID